MRIKSIVLAGVCCVILTGTAHAQWAGRMEKQDGEPHVLNPEEPMTTVRVEPEELWVRGGDDDDLFFGRLVQVVEDGDGNVYALDAQLSEILVFSPDGEHLRTVGREGEGPGEFAAASDMYLGPKDLLGIIRIFPGRIYQIGIDNTPADPFPLPKTEGFQLLHRARGTADRVVVAGAIQSQAEGKQIQTAYLKAYDPDGKEIAHYCDVKQEMRFGGMEFDEKQFNDFARRWALADDGRVAVAIDFDPYRIHVYNPDGTVNRIIERPDYELLERTSEEKERFQKFFDGITQWNRGSTFKVSDTHATVTGIWFRPNGNLWVLPSRGSHGREPGLLASIDEYNRDGQYVRRIDMVVDGGDPNEDGVFMVGARLYRVTDLFSSTMASMGGDENADAADVEPSRLVAYRLDIAEMGMK